MTNWIVNVEVLGLYKMERLLFIILLFSFSNLSGQEDFKTYELRSAVKNLTIRMYKAKEINGELEKGKLWDSRIPSNGTRFVEFDTVGNVTSVSSIDCNTLEHIPWYYFEREGDTVRQTNLNFKAKIRNVKTLIFKDDKLHKEYLDVNNDVSAYANKHINCHEEYFYDSLSAIEKILKYDENMGVVAMHEMVAHNKSNTLVEEVVIDCTPYMYKVFNPGNPPQYERKHKNLLYSIYRSYDSEGRLKLMYDDSKRDLIEFDEEGRMIKWTSFKSDHETVQSSSTYIYLDNGLLSQKVKNKDGVESVECEYTYKYNDRGDWLVKYENCPQRDYVYEREIEYWGE